jgi:nucleoid-associated protein YgaU
MRNFIISTLLSLTLFSLAANAQTKIELQDNPPDRYVVVKGDTLWDISNKFLKTPWRWPEIWQINKDEIKNPHWIYPGNVIILDLSGATPRLRLSGEGSGEVITKDSSGRDITVLNPQIRYESLAKAAIPSIPPGDIEPFLSQPLVIDENSLNNAPRIVAAQDKRVIMGAGNTAYVMGLKEAKGIDWQIYRKGRSFVDPDSREFLGYEAVYLGDAKVEKFDDASTIQITASKQEINKGDRLVEAPKEVFRSYIPHAPETMVKGRILAVYGGVAEGGRHSIVTISKGSREKLEPGHVLAIYRTGQTIKTDDTRETVKLPDERYGLIFVFRTFEKVSYGLVMQSNRPVQLEDIVQTP